MVLVLLMIIARAVRTESIACVDSSTCVWSCVDNVCVPPIGIDICINIGVDGPGGVNLKTRDFPNGLLVGTRQLGERLRILEDGVFVDRY